MLNTASNWMFATLYTRGLSAVYCDEPAKLTAARPSPLWNRPALAALVRRFWRSSMHGS
ncbi:hypothetical protein D9M71_457870 [compost metagenome]